MIKSIKIKNFKSHQKTSLDLSPGINVITGQSDAGKSAILGSIYWVTQNRPLGTAILRHGKDKAAVSIRTDHGKITKIKSDKVNRYIVTLAESGKKQKHVLDSVGTSVPDTLKKVINVDDLNFQRQHDPPFLVSFSSSEVARILNEAASLDEIDKAHSKVRSIQRQLISSIEHYKLQAKSVTEQIQSHKYVEKIERKFLKKALPLHQKLKTLKETEEDLSKAIKETLSIEEQIKEKCWAKTVDEKKVLSDCQAIKQRLIEISQTEKELTICISELKSIDERMKQILSTINKTKEEILSLNIQKCPLCGNVWKGLNHENFDLL